MKSGVVTHAKGTQLRVAKKQPSEVRIKRLLQKKKEPQNG